jgi:hypothetical protein
MLSKSSIILVFVIVAACILCRSISLVDLQSAEVRLQRTCNTGRLWNLKKFINDQVGERLICLKMVDEKLEFYAIGTFMTKLTSGETKKGGECQIICLVSLNNV